MANDQVPILACKENMWRAVAGVTLDPGRSQQGLQQPGQGAQSSGRREHMLQCSSLLSSVLGSSCLSPVKLCGTLDVIGTQLSTVLERFRRILDKG